MPTLTRSFTPTQPIDPPTSARPRVLSGLDVSPRGAPPARTPASRSAATPPLRAEGAARRPDALPRWVKGVVIGGVLLALTMPAAVLMSRSMLVQAALAEQSNSTAVLVCTSGKARAFDGSSVLGWLFGGAYFSCSAWETREARQQRDRERDQANFLARERARQQAR